MPISHDAKLSNPGFYLEETTRKALASWVRGSHPEVEEASITALVKKVDYEMRLAKDMRRKQTGAHTIYPRRDLPKPRYSRSNLQARNEMRCRLWSLHDLLPEVDSSDIGRAEFADIVLRDERLRRDLRLPKLNPEALQTSVESHALRETPKKYDRMARKLGRAERSGEPQPFLHQRIAEWAHARADKEHGITVAESRELDRGLRAEYARRDAVLKKLEEHDRVREGYEVFDRNDPAQAELRQSCVRIRWYERRVSKRTAARNRYWLEHPEEKELYREHHQCTLVEDARKDRALAEELAARGISLEERRAS